jgi:anti-sigma B factor antagonist
MTGEVTRSVPNGIVRRLWEAYRRGGVAEALEHVEEETEWIPVSDSGQALRGRAELERHYAQIVRDGTTVQIQPYEFETIGSAVLVSAGLRIRDPEGLRESQVHYLFELRDGRLVRVSAHRDRQSALTAAAGGAEVMGHAASRGEPQPAVARITEAGALRITRGAAATGEVRLALEGELDIGSAGELQDAIALDAHPGARVVLDIERLEYMDSTGLAILARAADAARREGWEFAVTHGTGQVRRVLGLSGLDSILPFA